MNRLGNTSVAILSSLGVVGASVAVFFVYTKGKLDPEPENAPNAPPAEVAGTDPKVNPGEENPGTPEKPPVKPDPSNPDKPKPENPEVAKPNPEVDPAEVVAGMRFETSGALAEKIGSQILKGEYAAAAVLISGVKDGGSFTEADDVLKLIFEKRALKPDPEGFGEIGQTGAAHRYGMKLANSDGSEAGRIVMDLTRDVKRGWKVDTIEVPKEIAAALPKREPGSPGVVATNPGDPVIPPPPGGEKPSKPLVVEERPEDALAAAESFVASLLKQNYDAARETSDFKRVSSEKIAGLCIVFEEGEYQMRKTKPLITTAAQAGSAWVIARLEHADGKGGAEFGIELERADDEWKVVALNLSKLLTAFTADKTTEGVAYAPMVASPQGGQSIALYFEFDDSDIHPRAARQLEIISKVLKGDATKTLKITGHADQLGDEDYNVKLSKARAANVKSRLLELGVNVEQILTTGAGEAFPLKPNVREDGSDDPEARSHNRRAEIFLDF